MTKQDLIEKLNEIRMGDLGTEEKHMEADDLLVKFINDSEIETAYDAINKWYA